MIITAIEHGLDLTRSFGPPRSPGAHMSPLYNAVYAKLEPKRYAKKADDRPPKERWAIGMAFEDMLEEGLKSRACQEVIDNPRPHEQIERPGEFQTLHTDTCKVPEELRVDGMGCWCGGGVYYSPDLLIFNKVTRLGEIKLNSMSAKGIPWKLGAKYDGFDQKYDKYFTQMKCYCYHLGTPFARLYSFSIREMVYFNEPQIFRAWDVKFTKRELLEEWEWVLNNARHEGLVKKAA